jgi:hypothetical protein
MKKGKARENGQGKTPKTTKKGDMTLDHIN